MRQDLDLYTDFLLSTFGSATATHLSSVVDGAVSHDSITRFLSSSSFSSKDLWLSNKKLIRQYESDNACLIIDDTIIPKPHMQENELISWHFDHSQGRSVKGANLLTAFYHSHPITEELPVRVPIGFRLILKTLHYFDEKSQKEKRKSPVTKNELLREMVAQAICNQLKFKYVLADSWFASAENMRFIASKKKFFIFDMKRNRQAVLSETDRNQAQWTRIDELAIPDHTPVKVWLKGLKMPVLLIKQVFTNKDNTTGVRFLVTNDFSLSNQEFTSLYQKRWSVEEYHKSLKQNAAIAKSPARKVKTQSNHLFAAIIAYTKMEKLKLKQQLNHFAIKAKIYLRATQEAMKELHKLKQRRMTA